ncbi:MAG: hypothetical protein ACI4EA_08500 [Candidatus Ornithomonoglobus sp.]
MTKLYYVATNAYSMVIAKSEGGIRYLTETEEFPIMTKFEPEERVAAAERFLWDKVEDTSSWDDDIQDIDELLDGNAVLATIEKEL